MPKHMGLRYGTKVCGPYMVNTLTWMPILNSIWQGLSLTDTEKDKCHYEIGL
jgi:hypothetical protein